METQAVLDPNLQDACAAPADEDLARRQASLRRVFEEQADFLLGVLRSYAVRFGGATGQEVGALALDVFSDLFAEAMKIAHKFDPERPAAAWLLGIAVNLMLRQREARGKERQRAGQQVSMGDHDSDDVEMFNRLAYQAGHHDLWTPPASWEKAQGAAELLALVNREDQEVLRLAIVHQLSGEALAQHWDVLPATARQRVHRAVKRLGEAYRRAAI